MLIPKGHGEKKKSIFIKEPRNERILSDGLVKKNANELCFKHLKILDTNEFGCRIEDDKTISSKKSNIIPIFFHCNLFRDGMEL